MAEGDEVKHNPMIYVAGDWYIVETDAIGKKWAVSEFYRVPLKAIFENLRTMIDEAHAVGVR